MKIEWTKTYKDIKWNKNMILQPPNRNRQMKKNIITVAAVIAIIAAIAYFSQVASSQVVGAKTFNEKTWTTTIIGWEMVGDTFSIPKQKEGDFEWDYNYLKDSGTLKLTKRITKTAPKTSVDLEKATYIVLEIKGVTEKDLPKWKSTRKAKLTEIDIRYKYPSSQGGMIFTYKFLAVD
jgi:hypothetical protein